MTNTLSLSAINPGSAKFDVVGSSVESPRALSGMSSAINFTGGGLVTVEYNNCFPGNDTPAKNRYMSYLGALLNGGTTNIYVPLLTDFIAPTATDLTAGDIASTTVPFSDGTTFSDGTEFAQGLVAATFSASAALNAALVEITFTAGGPAYGGDWFSVTHPNKDKRVYRIKQLVSYTGGVDGSVCQCLISPPLREAIDGTEEISFVRPECTMRLAPGFTIPVSVEPSWLGTYDLKFIEAGWAA